MKNSQSYSITLLIYYMITSMLLIHLFHLSFFIIILISQFSILKGLLSTLQSLGSTGRLLRPLIWKSLLVVPTEMISFSEGSTLLSLSLHLLSSSFWFDVISPSITLLCIKKSVTQGCCCLTHLGQGLMIQI